METDAATRRYRLWLRGLRSLRGDLKSARWSNDPAQLSALVGRFVAHLEAYHAARAELVDPVVALSAPWATAAERGAAYWLAGWRPTTLVHLLYTESGRRLEAQLADLLLGVRWPGSLGDLGPAQLARVDALQRRAVAEEDALSREMARVQEGHGGVVTAELALDAGALVARVGAVLRGADALRLRTVREAVEILQPAQAAELLIAAADLEIGFREFGLQVRVVTSCSSSLPCLAWRPPAQFFASTVFVWAVPLGDVRFLLVHFPFVAFSSNVSDFMRREASASCQNRPVAGHDTP